MGEMSRCGVSEKGMGTVVFWLKGGVFESKNRDI